MAHPWVKSRLAQPGLVPLVDREASDALMSWQFRFALRSGETHATFSPRTRGGKDEEDLKPCNDVSLILSIDHY